MDVRQAHILSETDFQFVMLCYVSPKVNVKHKAHVGPGDHERCLTLELLQEENDFRTPHEDSILSLLMTNKTSGPLSYGVTEAIYMEPEMGC